MDLSRAEGIIKTIKDRYHYRLYMDSLHQDIGTYASGHWGHRGRPGQHGGSLGGSGGKKYRMTSASGKYMSVVKQQRAIETIKKANTRCDEIRKQIGTRRNSIKYAIESVERDIRTTESLISEYEKERDEHEQALKQFPDAPRLRMVHEIVCEEIEKRKKELEGHKEKIEEIKASQEAQEVEALVTEYNRRATQRDSAVKQAFPSAGDCKTSEDVTDYIRANRLYRDNGQDQFDTDQKVDLTAMSTSGAVKTAEHLERMFSEFPQVKGRLGGIICRTPLPWEIPGDEVKPSAYAIGESVVLNAEYYGENNIKKWKEDYQRNVATGYCPAGTDEMAVIEHETAHAIEAYYHKRNGTKSGRIGDRVMKATIKDINGSYDKELELSYRQRVSSYAYNNQGVQVLEAGHTRKRTTVVEDKKYGRNTEFLAEATAQGINSPESEEVSRVALKHFKRIVKSEEKKLAKKAG